MKVEMNLTGLDGVLATLQSLPPEVVSKRGGLVLRALRKGAQVIRKQATSNLASAIRGVDKEGNQLSTGLLLQKGLSISRKNPPSGVTGEMVRIRVRRAIYPNRKRNSGRRGGSKLATNDTAWFLEFGTAKQSPRPWLRPAFQAKAEAAIRTTEAELLRQIDRVVKKLASQNAGRK
jgi:HK97 gp10 family phage protein